MDEDKKVEKEFDLPKEADKKDDQSNGPGRHEDGERFRHRRDEERRRHEHPHEHPKG